MNTSERSGGAFTTLLTPEDLADLTCTMGTKIAEYFQKIGAVRPIIIGVLPEAFPLVADVLRCPYDVRLELGFVTLANLSRGPRAQNIRLHGQFPNIEGRDAVFVHTRVKSGATIRYINNIGAYQGANSVVHHALIYQRPDENVHAVAWPDCHVYDAAPGAQIFGYGLPVLPDLHDRQTPLPAVYDSVYRLGP